MPFKNIDVGLRIEVGAAIAKGGRPLGGGRSPTEFEGLGRTMAIPEHLVIDAAHNRLSSVTALLEWLIANYPEKEQPLRDAMHSVEEAQRAVLNLLPDEGVTRYLIKD